MVVRDYQSEEGADTTGLMCLKKTCLIAWLILVNLGCFAGYLYISILSQFGPYLAIWYLGGSCLVWSFLICSISCVGDLLHCWKYEKNN